MNMQEMTAMIEEKMDEMSQMFVEEYPTGMANATRSEKLCWMDGFVDALSWMLEVVA